MARSEDLASEPVEAVAMPGGPTAPRVLRTGRLEEEGGRGDGLLAILSLALLIAGMLAVSYVIFSL